MNENNRQRQRTTRNPARPAGAARGTGQRSTNVQRSADAQRRGYADPRRRAQIAARRRRRRRQRRILICMMLAVLLAMLCGAGFGIRKFFRSRTQHTLRSEAITFMESGEYESAASRLDEALKLSGNKIGKFETDVLQYHAEADYQMGDYAAALSCWKKLLEKEKENVLYKENAALCMIEMGDYEGALALGVLQGRIYNHMAVEKIQAGDYDGALADIDQGMAADDGSAAADLAYNQAVAYEGKLDFSKALELFEAYVERFGADENAEREITFLRSRQGGQQETGAQDNAGDQNETGAQGETAPQA